MRDQGIVEIGTYGGDHRDRGRLCGRQRQVDEAIDIGGVLRGSPAIAAGRALRVKLLPLVDIQQQPIRLAIRQIQFCADHVRQ